MSAIPKNRRSRLLSVGFVLALMVACAPPPHPGRVYVRQGPPRVRVEVIGRAPGPDYAWVPGYWRWSPNSYAWVSGHYVVRDRGYRSWVPGRWSHDRRGWYFVEGHWRR